MSFTFAGTGLLIGNPIAGALLDLEHAVFWKTQLFSAITLVVGTILFMWTRLLKGRMEGVWKIWPRLERNGFSGWSCWKWSFLDYYNWWYWYFSKFVYDHRGERHNSKLILLKTAPNFCIADFMHIQMPVLVFCPSCKLHGLRTAIVNFRPSSHVLGILILIKSGAWRWPSHAIPKWLKRPSWLGSFSGTQSRMWDGVDGVGWYRIALLQISWLEIGYLRLAFYLLGLTHRPQFLLSRWA